jgi:hypothetical protein
MILLEISMKSDNVCYTPEDYDWWAISEDELVPDTDERVRNINCLIEDKMVNLSEIRQWLSFHARNYYESDSWSSFDSEQMIIDLCKHMLYNK